MGRAVHNAMSFGMSGAVSAAPDAAPGDFLALTKPRVMSLVVFTGLAGLVAAPGAIHPVLAVVALLCIALAAGGAGALNMWYERDVDALMSRTKGRPLPAGRMAPGAALGFGIVLIVGAVALMGLALNWAAAALLALSAAFYVFVYTIWLKRRTPQNIVIGGAAGAFPPIIGWAAVTGDVGLTAIALFAIIFIWTPPHFWALALYRAGDYAAAGIPMLPVVSGARETRRQIVIYSVVLAPLGLAPWWLGAAGPAFAIIAAVLGLIFLAGAIMVSLDKTDRSARRLFGYSILYLFLLFAALIGERVVLGI